MKRIIFVEGVNGSGKTTFSRALQQEIIAECDLQVEVLNKRTPDYYSQLFEVDKKHNIDTSILGKISYRIARLYLALDIAVQAHNKIAIFDRGIINTLLDCQFQNIDPQIYQVFIDDILCRYRRYGILIVLLNPPFEVIQERLEKRIAKRPKEGNTEYLSFYYHSAQAAFDTLPLHVEKIIIDSHKKNVSEIVQCVIERLK